jgi:hypothetical protein
VHFVGSVYIFGSDQCPEDATCLRHTPCCEGTVLNQDRSDKGHYKWPDRVDYSLIVSDAVSPGM